MSIYLYGSKLEGIQKISKVALWKKILVIFRREILITVYFLSSVENWADRKSEGRKKRENSWKKVKNYYAFGGDFFVQILRTVWNCLDFRHVLAIQYFVYISIWDNFWKRRCYTVWSSWTRKCDSRVQKSNQEADWLVSSQILLLL